MVVLELALLWMAEKMPWFNLRLQDPWKEVSILLFIYVAAQGRNVLKESIFGITINGRKIGVFGYLISLISGIIAVAFAAFLASSSYLSSQLNISTVTTISVIVGLTLYRIGSAMQFSIDRKIAGELFLTNFTIKLRNIPLLWLFLLPLVPIALWAETSLSKQTNLEIGFYVFVALQVMVSLFHYTLSKDEGKPNVFWQLKNLDCYTGNFKMAIGILTSVLIILATILSFDTIF